VTRVKTHRASLAAVGETAPPKILYVGGSSRSGSTLVGRILGEAPNAICVGETRYLWDRGLIHDVQCGCGQLFRSCPFWSAIGEDAFGGWDCINAERLANMDYTLNRLRTVPLHWLPSLSSAFAAAIDEYVSLLTQLYVAIARVSGAQIIVETSKDPTFASLLTRMPGYDVRIIHLVRDSRAVAYSWTRDSRLPSPIGEEAFMPKFRPADAATRWLLSNASFHALATRHYAYARCRYESFVANPRDTLQNLSAMADEPLVLSTTKLMDKKVRLGEHHIFSGNPMRASTGFVEMRTDDKWQTELPVSHFGEVTMITWPLLRRYGYPIVPAATRMALRARFGDR
jgi:hypothetical protein